MPPLSPDPGWTRGDVWSERMARVRKRGATLPVGPAYGRGSSMVGADRDVVVVVLERLVDLDQRLLLSFGDAGVAQYLADQVVLASALFEDASSHVEGLGGDAQRLGDLLEDLGRGLAQPALDLAEVGVADARHVGELPERQPRHPPLLADELSEVVHACLELVLHVGHRLTVASATGAAANSGPRWAKRSARDEALDVVEQLDRRERLAEEVVGTGLAAGLLDGGVVAPGGQHQHLDLRVVELA